MTLAETLRQHALTGASQSIHDDSLKGLRTRGRERLSLVPFPERKTERWKYTSLQALEPGHLQRPAPVKRQAPDVPALGDITLCVVNGQIPEQWPELPPGLQLSRMSADLEAGTLDEDNVFACYNAATFNDGLHVQVAADARLQQTLHLVFLNTSEEEAAVSVRLRVVLQQNSSLNIIEHYLGTGPILTTAVTQIECGDNSQLVHTRLQSEAADVLHVGMVGMDLSHNSRVQSFQFMQGCRLRRNEVRARMLGEGAELTLRGVFIARDATHVDNQITVEHCVPHCRSDQIFKGIAAEQGKAVFNGRIHIHPGARGTDAVLSNRNLLLSSEAEIDTKPELEIYNDDVKCAHGTTVGQMDHQQLFYLQSRGISEDVAKRMLASGFVNELVRAMPQERQSAWVDDWLGQML